MGTTAKNQNLRTIAAQKLEKLNDHFGPSNCKGRLI